MGDPVLKAIVKYKDHPSIKRIERVPKSKDWSNFPKVERNWNFQEIVYLEVFKACQDTDKPTKTIKESADIFEDFVHPSVNASLSQ